MHNLNQLKCLNCGSSVAYAKGGLYCESCDSLLSFEDYKEEAEKKYDFNNEVIRDYNVVKEMEVKEYICESCGAAIEINNNETSAICPYCCNAMVPVETKDESQMPDFIVPFKLTKKEAIEAYENHKKKLKFLPIDFSTSIIDKLNSIYLPYWFLSEEIEGTYDYKCENRNKDNKVIARFVAERSANISLKNMPNIASDCMPIEFTESIEPYPVETEAREYDPKYLNGHLGEKFRNTIESCKNRFVKRREATVDKIFDDSVTGYDDVDRTYKNIKILDYKYLYGLVPAFVMAVKYNNELHRIGINGQTKKVIGNFPIDMKKFALNIVKQLAILNGVLSVLMFIFARDEFFTKKFFYGVLFTIILVGANHFRIWRLHKSKRISTNFNDYIKNVQFTRKRDYKTR